MCFTISFILILMDQLVKFFCINKLSSIGSLRIIENFFYLTYVENRGAAFGILEGNKVLFIILSIIAVILCLFYFFSKNFAKLNFLYKISLILIISGAIGNLIDRMFRGFVIDMFHFIFFKKDFAVFNCADIYIVLGVFLLFFVMLYNYFCDKKGFEDGNF